MADLFSSIQKGVKGLATGLQQGVAAVPKKIEQAAKSPKLKAAAMQESIRKAKEDIARAEGSRQVQYEIDKQLFEREQARPSSMYRPDTVKEELRAPSVTQRPMGDIKTEEKRMREALILENERQRLRSKNPAYAAMEYDPIGADIKANVTETLTRYPRNTARIIGENIAGGAGDVVEGIKKGNWEMARKGFEQGNSLDFLQGFGRGVLSSDYDQIGTGAIRMLTGVGTGALTALGGAGVMGYGIGKDVLRNIPVGREFVGFAEGIEKGIADAASAPFLYGVRGLGRPAKEVLTNMLFGGPGAVGYRAGKDILKNLPGGKELVSTVEKIEKGIGDNIAGAIPAPLLDGLNAMPDSPRKEALINLVNVLAPAAATVGLSKLGGKIGGFIGEKMVKPVATIPAARKVFLNTLVKPGFMMADPTGFIGPLGAAFSKAYQKAVEAKIPIGPSTLSNAGKYMALKADIDALTTKREPLQGKALTKVNTELKAKQAELKTLAKEVTGLVNVADVIQPAFGFKMRDVDGNEYIPIKKISDDGYIVRNALGEMKDAAGDVLVKRLGDGIDKLRAVPDPTQKGQKIMDVLQRAVNLEQMELPFATQKQQAVSPKQATSFTQEEFNNMIVKTIETMKKPTRVMGKGEFIESAPRKGYAYGSVSKRLQSYFPELDNPEIYKKISQDAEIKAAINRAVKDPKQAYRNAMYIDESKNAVFRNTAENMVISSKAIEEGNYKLANELIRKRSFRQRDFGRSIGLEATTVLDMDPQKYITDVLARKYHALGNRFTTKLTKGMLKNPADRARKVIDDRVGALYNKFSKKKVLDFKEAQSLLKSYIC